MLAYFDAKDGSPKVFIKVRSDKRRKKKVISALLDTGHNGSLSLPMFALIDMGAKLKSYGQVQFADGNTAICYYFEVCVEIDGKEKRVLANMINNPKISEAIVGLELLSPYIAIIDFKNKKIDLSTEKKLKKKYSKS